MFLSGVTRTSESSLFRCRKQLAILQRVPTELRCWPHHVASEKRPNRKGRSLIEHRRLRRRGLQTASGKINYGYNLLAIQSVEPLEDIVDIGATSKFSKIAATGIRVPRSTQAPLNLPGTLSTSGHCDQSRAAMV